MLEHAAAKRLKRRRKRVAVRANLVFCRLPAPQRGRILDSKRTAIQIILLHCGDGEAMQSVLQRPEDAVKENQLRRAQLVTEA